MMLFLTYVTEMFHFLVGSHFRNIFINIFRIITKYNYYFYSLSKDGFKNIIKTRTSHETKLHFYPVPSYYGKKKNLLMLRTKVIVRLKLKFLIYFS